jgi:hypothetical protein
VRTKNHASLPIAVPGGNQISHVYRLSLTHLPGRETLESDLCTPFAEVFSHEFLLFSHPVAAADSRSDLANLFDVFQRSFAVKCDFSDPFRAAIHGKTLARSLDGLILFRPSVEHPQSPGSQKSTNNEDQDHNQA